jgi:predicted permease
VPEWKEEIRQRLANLKLAPTREAEIVDELAQHLDDRYTELRAGGAAEDGAYRSALAELSESDLLTRELQRVERPVELEPVVLGARRSNMIGDLWLDLRYAVRLLGKNPSFTAVAIITLALGIGANSAIFSLVNALLLRPLSAARPEELVRVYTGSSHTSFPNYRDLSDDTQAFSTLAAHCIAAFNLGNAGQEGVTGRVFGELVTGSYFPALGVPAFIGHAFGIETDGPPGAHPVVVMSHGLWERRFGADAGMVGKTIILNGRQFTVIGIMPEGFRGTFAFGLTPEVWVPVTMQPVLLQGADRFNDRGRQWLEVFGRLRPGVTRSQAQAAISVIARRLVEVYPDQSRGMDRTEIYPLSGIFAFRGLSFAPAIFVFLGLLTVIVGLVLLIACANIANLLLARAVTRQKEVAIRLALGAGRRRLIRQFLTESVLLALAGGAAGCLLAFWIVNALRSFQPPLPVPMELDLTLDARVLGYTLVVSVLSGVLFGLAPAWHSSKYDIVPLLKDEGGTRGGRSARFGLRNLLVAAQVAVSLVLLICAGLFIRSLQQVHTVDPGFETERMLTVSLDLEPVGYDRVRGNLFYRQLLDQVESLPGVQSASLAESIPLTFSRTTFSVAVEGYDSADGDYPGIDNNTIGPRYFETMGIPVVAGREFNRQDNESAARVVIVNETMARRFWPDQSPLGRRLRFPGGGDTFGPYHEIVGVVKDSKYGTLGEGSQSFFYLSSLQNYSRHAVLHIRTSGEPTLLRSGVGDSILSLNGALLVEVVTMRENLATAFLPARVGAALLGLFGVLGLSLAVVGIYGVISYAVSQRTGEIGLRMALGARPRDILRLVIGRAMKLTMIGIGVGAAVSLMLTRLLRSLLVGVSPTDPLTFITLIVLFGLIALMACYIPARRATKVDPMVALRYE